MKLVTYRAEGKERVGALVGEEIVALPYQSVASVLSLWDALRPEAIKIAQDASTPRIARKDATLLAPIPRPNKLLCLAGNYSQHIREGGGSVPGKEKMTPRVFMKPPSNTVIGPGQPVILPKNGNQIDWECELGIVIGRAARFVTEKAAMSHVAGYTIVNDISERELKIDVDREPRPGDEWFDWLNGKWFDTFAPMGPCVATTEEVPDPHALRLTLKLNGEVKQDASTGQMIFRVPEIVAFISTLMTLEPGDVIATGTPAGVGNATDTYLKPGDVMEMEIEKIGAFRTPVKAMA
ncbi:MAG: fumarylacetoacetate hydrolase family protein [Planctomycetota bacterium]